MCMVEKVAAWMKVVTVLSKEFTDKQLYKYLSV